MFKGVKVGVGQVTARVATTEMEAMQVSQGESVKLNWLGRAARCGGFALKTGPTISRLAGGTFLGLKDHQRTELAD
jgi:hypothetical protein